jgi:uncharacterized membrane protein YdjX (TVP38/TMEM64 family)
LKFSPLVFLLRSFKKKQGVRRYIGPKRLILLLAFVLCVIMAWDYYRSGVLNPAIIQLYLNQYPTVSFLLFIMLYVVFVISSLPSLPLNLAAGFFWGGFLGGVYAAVAVTIGGWISFTLARWLIGQPLAKDFHNKWASKVQREFDQGGWKFVAFARINPIIPTGPLNYLLGLTSLSSSVFLGVTFLFLLPPSIAVAYIGDTLQTFTAQQSGVSEIVRGILIASAAVTFFVGIKYAYSIFKKLKDE